MYTHGLKHRAVCNTHAEIVHLGIVIKASLRKHYSINFTSFLLNDCQKQYEKNCTFQHRILLGTRRLLSVQHSHTHKHTKTNKVLRCSNSNEKKTLNRMCSKITNSLSDLMLNPSDWSWQLLFAY